MLNSLKIASDGYLKRTTKAVLLIAVAGYLNYGGTVPPIPPSTGLPPKKQLGGGALSLTGNPSKRYKKTKEEEEQQKIREENEIFNIIKMWLEIKDK